MIREATAIRWVVCRLVPYPCMTYLTDRIFSPR